MRRMMYWRAAVCAAAVIGGSSVPSKIGLDFFGVGPAEAKTYYTRKRVNGRWITGHFPKKSAIKKHVASAGRSATRRHEEAVESETAPAPRMTSLSARDAAPIIAAAPVAAAPALPLAQTASSPVPVAPQAASTAEPAVPLVPLSEDERLSKLREALRARANSLTTGTVAPAQAPGPVPEPHSVSLDFRTGTKTTIFSDGTSIQEPFDVGALKGLAAPPPSAGVK